MTQHRLVQHSLFRVKEVKFVADEHHAQNSRPKQNENCLEKKLMHKFKVVSFHNAYYSEGHKTRSNVA